MHNTLKEILALKQQQVAALKIQLTQDPHHVLAPYMQGESTRKIKSLKKALRKPCAIIAEIKRASPASGLLAQIPDPVHLAQIYQQAGAAAISVLTDETFFKGSLNDLLHISSALETMDCAILRKEFIIDEIQIAEAAHYGADAVLLIVAATQDKTEELLDFAHHLGLEALVEVHTLEELDYALEIEADIIGINNRNLSTLLVDIETSFALISEIPASRIVVSESGIKDAMTAQHLFAAGFDALLVGEALVRAEDPGELIRNMRGVAP